MCGLALAAVLAVLVVVAGAADPEPTQRITTTFNPAADPLGEIDSYRAIIDSDKEDKWAADPGRTLRDRFQALTNLSIATHIDVKLVGFSGDGNFGLNIQQADFVRFFEAALAEDAHVRVANPKGSTPKQLPIRHKYFFRVVKAKPELVKAVTKVVHKHALHKGKSSVPLEEVDELIRNDYKAGGKAYTIYLLNPKAAAILKTTKHNTTVESAQGPVTHEVESTNRELYSYWYIPPEDTWTPTTAKDKEEPSTKDIPSKPCPTVMWASNTHRYAWIDLTAGPVSYGPHTNGNGLVSDFTIPNLENFRLEDQEDEHHGVHEDDFVAEVTALVVKTCDALVHPLLHSFPVPYARRLKIKVIELSEEIAAPSPFNVKKLTEQLTRTNLRGQTVEVTHRRLAMSDCPLCHAALVSATKSRTSTIMRGTLRTALHEYVDSKELNDKMLDIILRRAQVAEVLDIEDYVRGDASERVLPVFLFGVVGELLLLDRHYQAVSFPDSVVAIQSSSPSVSVDFSCNDEPLAIDARDSTRAILGATLEAMWGVAAPHRFVNSATDREDVDFSWAIGYCPWGPFSQSTQLSFAQNDAIRRNQLLSELHSHTSHLSSIIESFFKYDQGVADVLLPQEYTHYLRRFNIFDYKLEKAAMFIALLDFDAALYYARSLRHDATALTNIFGRASDYVHSHMVCAQDAQISIVRDVVYVACLVVILVVVWKSRRIFFKGGSGGSAKSD